MGHWYMQDCISQLQLLPLNLQLFLYMVPAICKMPTSGGVRISGSTCFTIYWWTKAIQFWILIIEAVQDMAGIGGQAYIALWEVRICLIMLMVLNIWLIT